MLLSTLVVAGTVAASAVTNPFFAKRAALATAAEQITAIAPGSTKCVLSPENECSTGESSAPFLIAAMQRYGVMSCGEIAGLLAYLAFETGDLHYRRQLTRAGSGTACMCMPNYIIEYARSIPEVKAKADAISTEPDVANMTPQQLNAIRDLVIVDEYNWASPAWFLTTHCPEQRAQLATGTDQGFMNFMTECIGVEATDERMAVWGRAKAAFGL